MSIRRIAAIFAVCVFFAVQVFAQESSWGVSGSFVPIVDGAGRKRRFQGDVHRRCR